MEPATFRHRLCYIHGRSYGSGAKIVFPYILKERKMAWKTPTIAEVSVGMEINMYACATRK